MSHEGRRQRSRRWLAASHTPGRRKAIGRLRASILVEQRGASASNGLAALRGQGVDQHLGWRTAYARERPAGPAPAEARREHEGKMVSKTDPANTSAITSSP